MAKSENPSQKQGKASEVPASHRPEVHRQLNRLVKASSKNGDIRIMCCDRWRRFGDGEDIGDKMAEYATEVFDGGASAEQLAAIRSFPTPALRLLRHLVVQVLDCPLPKPDPIPPIDLQFDAQVRNDPAIEITIGAGGRARVRLCAPGIV